METTAVGGFAIQLSGGTATYTLAVVGIEAFSQAHIHQGAAGTNGGIIAFLASHDPAVSGDVLIEGTLRTSDLIGALAGDWDGFLADLVAGNLYVNVHTSANLGGEIRGQLAADTDATVNVSVDVPAGSSLFGWFGLDTGSGAVLASNDTLTGIWWLGPDGWILDSPILPDALRTDIAITSGTGILLLADAATSLDVTLARPNPDLTAALAPQDGSGVHGVATLSTAGDGTRIRVTVLGLSEGDHANHLHHGSCADAELGAIHVPLSDLSAGADGDASGTTVWADNGIDHFASGHYVAAHELVTFAVIACGDVQ